MSSSDYVLIASESGPVEVPVVVLGTEGSGVRVRLLAPTTLFRVGAEVIAPRYAVRTRF